jgi:oligoendopeptidase F
VAKEDVEPLRRYHRLRRRVLGLDTYRLFDVLIPLVEHDVRYPYDEVGEWIVDSVAPLGADYQQLVREAFRGRWIDVFENAGKRSGAYSAPVYGAHPYMLLNYNETLDAVFTLAHEMGHSMHTLLSHQAQPFVYAGYTIFVAEVPSTLSEALFLDFMLERARSRDERAVLLQHAIDSIASTFYTQVMFADFELQAHRLVEQDQPVTADRLNGVFAGLLREYYGDVIDEEELSRLTWARIPHFFSTPYYVYQYATCFASTARLMQDVRAGEPLRRADGVDRYLSLLRAGGSDYPMSLLARAGVDLSQPDTVRAVSVELDMLVARLESTLAGNETP